MRWNVEQVSSLTYKIEGKPYKIEGKPYKITGGKRVTSCTCPDFEQRGKALGYCKHLVGVRIVLQAKARVKKMGADRAIGYAVTRLAWEQEPFSKDCLKALLNVARQEQVAVLEVA